MRGTKSVLWLVALVGMGFGNAEGASSWGSPWASWVEGSGFGFEYDWGVDLSMPGEDGAISCSTPQCVFGVWPRSGVGAVGQTCDAGGVCGGAEVASGQFGIPMVVVANGTSWGRAYELFVAKYGAAGHARIGGGYSAQLPSIAWGRLCVGFGYLPLATAITILAPNTTCGVIPPPNVTCMFSIPGEINLGTVTTGPVDVHASVVGSYQCSTVATITAALPSPPLLAGLAVRMTLGGQDLRTTPVTITTGVGGTLPLSAAAKGTTNVVGVHSVAVPLVLSYY